MKTTSHLPMPLTRARRIESERVVYRDLQRRHHAEHPDYARGWCRPSDATAARVLELIGAEDADLTVTEHLALVVVLDAAIQAGEDGRLLSHNLVFDALASRWSDWYRAAIERGPARVSWEMTEATLKGAWRDLLRNDISMSKMLRLAQRGYGLYETRRGRDGRYTVELTGKTEERRRQLLDVVKDDIRSGGTYKRRSWWPRLRLADEPHAASTVKDATTYKVVDEFAYNVAVPGERRMKVIRHLESTILGGTAGRLEAEYDWLMDRAEAVFLQAHELGVDVTKSVAMTRVRDAGTGEMRDGASAWRRHLGRLIAKTPKDERAGLKKRAIALAKEYDKVIGQARQLRGPMTQLLDLVRAGKLERDEEVATRTRYATLSNRRFQARDFWFSEISGKAATEIVEQIGCGHFEDDYGNAIEVAVDRVASRRGRLFRIGASRPWREREWIEKQGGEIAASVITDDIQDIVGVDVSGSQIQIYAVLLGLRDLENELRKNAAKVIFAWRAWARHKDPRDPFKLSGDYTGRDDPQLQAAVKAATMTSLYDSKPGKIVERLEDDPDEYGAGLGTAANLTLFLRDHELGLDVIERLWKPAMRRGAALAYKADRYTGIVLTDPYEGVPFRLNPVKWSVPRDHRAAGTGDVRVSAKVPADTKKNAAGELPVWKQKMASMLGPTFIHMLDAMFCGLVVEELIERDVKVVPVHDAWYVAADAAGKLRDAVRAASIKWMQRLGVVYDDLERLLGTCTPPKRGKRKGQCCGRCANWIKKLRATWQARVDAGDYPEFRTGDASPSEERYR